MDRGVALGARLVCVLGLLVAGKAMAAGFALKEQSTAALGNAFAGATAGAEDPSYSFFNPAALAYQPGIQTAAALSWIAPRAELETANASTAIGVPVAGRRHKGDVAEDALVPALYASWQVDPRLTVGLAINAPFGLTTRYPRNWVGRYHALDSELRTLSLTPMVALRPTEGLAVGFGLQLLHAQAELSNAIDFGSIGAAVGIPGAIPTAQDGQVRLEGDGFGAGVVAGMLVEPWAGTRIGLGYRSRVGLNLRGDADFTLDGAGIGAILSALTGRFVDTGAEARLTLPDLISFGLYQELGRGVAVMAEAQLTRWGVFDELRVRFDNPAEADNITEEKWQDSWFFALGASWRPMDGLVLRTGIAHDQTPIRTRYRTPRIPGDDRWWLTFGLSWQPQPGFTLDLGYTHIWVESSRLRLTAAGAGNLFRGNLTARYDNAIDIVTLNGRLRF